MKHLLYIGILGLSLTLASCVNPQENTSLRTGAENTEAYLSLLKGKRVGLLTNHTALIEDKHLVDSLLSLGVDIRMIFAPEHGFRGNEDAGAQIDHQIDPKTGIPVISVYGRGAVPADSLMQQIDIAIFDIQDVGLRFYTYLSSLYYLMEACAVNNVPLLVLDRPNPNGHMASGPVLDMQYRSFVGVIPIPVVHAMTLGELACMINGEFWLQDSLQAPLTVIPCLNYTHQTIYELPVKPSPNLPNNRSIYLYPSICLFEATPVSLGRGTDFPFQVYGHPQMAGHDFSFTPQSVPGARNPIQKDVLCYGVDLRTSPPDEVIRARGFDLQYVIDAYRNLNENAEIGDEFFTSYFEKLVGVDYVRPMILQGKTADQIAALWADQLEDFKVKRNQYLIYPQ
ncbi:MAG TPA: DUF1343 domain-containing protein [Bacteroidales bacterium]|nr:DUF1343 domain-containing protein [Bacteroidales bacterium]